MFAFPRSRRLLALLAAVVAVGLVALTITAFGVANAKTGIKTIGPGPSSNTAGVKCIQRALGVTPADGRYGQSTYTAVKRFQKSKGLSMDGAVGPETGQKLLSRAPAGCASSIPTLGATSSSTSSGGTSSSSTTSQSTPESAAQACYKQGKVSDGKGGCVSDGVVALGKPASECVAELAGKQFFKELNNARKQHKSEREAQKLAKDASDQTQRELDNAAKKATGKRITISALKEIGKKGTTIASLYKCMFWDKPDQ